MKLSAVASCLFMAACLVAEEPQAATTPQARAEAALARFAPLVGNTYIAEIPGNPGMTDTVTFTKALDGKFIRSVHYMRAPTGQIVYRGEAFYGYDMRDDQLFYSYFNTTGGFIRGVGKIEDGKVVWTGENHADARQPKQTRDATSNIAKDGFQSTSYFLVGDDWQERWTLTFKRVADEKDTSKSADSGDKDNSDTSDKDK